MPSNRTRPPADRGAIGGRYARVHQPDYHRGGRHDRSRARALGGIEGAGYRRCSHDPDHAPALHPTVKPVTMIMDAIKDTSKRREIVLDPFGGSGSTLIAAHKTGRRGRLIEYEPDYCAVTIRRWQKIARQGGS